MSGKWLVLATAWMCVSAAATVHAGSLQVGVGKTMITPDPLLPVSGGLGPTAPVSEQRGELTARAVVLQRDDVAWRL